MKQPIVVVCTPGCHGVGDMPCITQIQSITDNGGTAFMIYSQHVREKLDEMGGFKLKFKFPEGNLISPIVMWISKA